jgi:hypothetical protein
MPYRRTPVNITYLVPVLLKLVLPFYLLLRLGLFYRRITPSILLLLVCLSSLLYPFRLLYVTVRT